jgi:hypothetical protein
MKRATQITNIYVNIYTVDKVFTTFDPNTGVPIGAEIKPIRPDPGNTGGGSVTMTLFCAPLI